MSAILLRCILTLAGDDESQSQTSYPSLSPATQLTLKSTLLESVSRESSKSISKKLCDTVSELVSLVLPENVWPEFMFQCVTSGNPRNRERVLIENPVRRLGLAGTAEFILVKLAEVPKEVDIVAYQLSVLKDLYPEGNLIHISDVQDVTFGKLEEWIRSFGGFDLMIGRSPCNNLAGCNRRTRDGLEGEHSSLFFDYVRVLDAVKSIMGRN
ncbi:hypothetical protein L1987_20964 [Smallanthus sonchifolius]|uniref:Uncharacterized protein n=1 Tax=Smallanthus sonchifolius TaxID=185202 RepID=A0ACB9ITB2_9ASTR|nr:hypothetical protein L1987_20964 [Smallanthus sonchifolius]